MDKMTKKKMRKKARNLRSTKKKKIDPHKVLIMKAKMRILTPTKRTKVRKVAKMWDSVLAAVQMRTTKKKVQSRNNQILMIPRKKANLDPHLYLQINRIIFSDSILINSIQTMYNEVCLDDHCTNNCQKREHCSMWQLTLLTFRILSSFCLSYSCNFALTSMIAF